jgi:hypothetical protein
MTLVVLAAGPAGADPETMATANRMVNGDGATNHKCMEIAGGGPSSELVQMAGCQSYAHQGWTLQPQSLTLDTSAGPVTYTVYTVRSHDPDAAGRCLDDWGPGWQAHMSRGCRYWPALWFKRPLSNGWFKLEAVEPWYFDYLQTGNPADRVCLDVLVGPAWPTYEVISAVCGPSNDGSQMFRIQAA